MATCHTRAHESTSIPLIRQQLLQEELVQLRRDYAVVSETLAKAHQGVFMAEKTAKRLHQEALTRQMQKVTNLQKSLQSLGNRRRSGYQAKIDCYRSLPYKILMLVSTLLGTTIPQNQISSDVRDLRRLRDVPDEEEQQLRGELMRELRVLNVLQSRYAFPDTPKLRQRREQVRIIQSYLSALHRQIRSKEIELASLTVLQNGGQPTPARNITKFA